MSKQVYFIGNAGMTADTVEDQRFAWFYSLQIEKHSDEGYYLFKVNNSCVIHIVPVDKYTVHLIGRFAETLWGKIIEILHNSEKISIINVDSLIKEIAEECSAFNENYRPWEKEKYIPW